MDDPVKGSVFTHYVELPGDAEDEEDASALLQSQSDKDFSFCDALSFVVMERLGIQETIAFDRHFREYGRFLILP